MTLKKWTPRAALVIYCLLLLVATLRAWLKFDAETAGKVLGGGLVFGVVLWRVWLYILAIRFGGRSQFSRHRL